MELPRGKIHLDISSTNGEGPIILKGKVNTRTRSWPKCFLFVFFQFLVGAAKGLVPLDKNGLSDPYTKVKIIPHDALDEKAKNKTKTHRKNLNPEFNAAFSIGINPGDEAKRLFVAVTLIHFFHLYILNNMLSFWRSIVPSYTTNIIGYRFGIGTSKLTMTSWEGVLLKFLIFWNNQNQAGSSYLTGSVQSLRRQRRLTPRI